MKLFPRQIDRYYSPQNYVDFLFVNILQEEKSPMIFDITKDQAHKVYECLEQDLSPENLHEDGEAKPREVTKKLKFYGRVIYSLVKDGHQNPPKKYKVGDTTHAFYEVQNLREKIAHNPNWLRS